MRRTRFSESQIVRAIKEHENGGDTKDICREQAKYPSLLQMAAALWRYGSGELRKYKEL